MMNSLQFLHGEAERNWACHQSPHYEVRKSNISEMTNPALRMGERFMLEFSRVLPGLSQLAIRRSLPPEGWQLAGAGSAHTALTDGDRVVKVHRRSVFLNGEDRLNLADQFRHDHHVLRNYLGNIVVPQTTKVGRNPLNTKRLAVLSTQPFVEFESPDIFDGYRPAINKDAYNKALAAHPGLDDALRDVAQGGLKMFSEKGLLPDTSGLNNFVLSGGELRCLDGLPLRPVKESETVRIVGQLQDILAISS